MLYFIVILFGLLFIGCLISVLTAMNTSRIDRPPVYWSESFQGLIIGISVIGILISFISGLILAWESTLIIYIIALSLGKLILKPIAEVVIVLPLHFLVVKKE